MTTNHTKIVTQHKQPIITYRRIAQVIEVSFAAFNLVIKLKKTQESFFLKCKRICGCKRKTATKNDLRKKKKISSSIICRRLLAVVRKARRPVKNQLPTKVIRVKSYKCANNKNNSTIHVE